MARNNKPEKPEEQEKQDQPPMPMPEAIERPKSPYPPESEVSRIAFVRIPGFDSPANGIFAVGAVCDFPKAPTEDRVDSAVIEDIWIDDKRMVHVVIRSVDLEKRGERRLILVPLAVCTLVKAYEVPSRLPECCFVDGSTIRHRKFMSEADKERERQERIRAEVEKGMAAVKAKAEAEVAQ